MIKDWTVVEKNNEASHSQESTDNKVETVEDATITAIPAPHIPHTSPLTPSKNPECKRVTSSIRNALESVAKDGTRSQGLLKFFSKGTTEDTKAYWAHEEEIAAATQSNSDVFNSDVADTEKKQHVRELAKQHQRKHCQNLKDRDIQNKV